MAAFETPVGYFRIVGIHGLGSGPRIWWPVVASVVAPVASRSQDMQKNYSSTKEFKDLEER